jgi:DNA (cytosine-5)-methyltransferase 1
VKPVRVAELCAGYGGLYLAMRAAGWPVELTWYAENDPDAAAVMAAHHSGVTNVGDITAADWARCEPVDILAAGYPCQDLSNAGKRAGIEGARSGIWRNVAHAIRDLRPGLAFLENVSAHLARGFGRVVGDLAEIGYDATWTCLRASDIGAPHRRDRVFILAEPADPDGQSVREQLVAVAARHRTALAGPDRPHVGGLIPTPTRRDRLAGLGHQGRQGGPNLRTAVDLVLTPAARDSGRGSGYGEDPGRPLSETVHRLLPTPVAKDAQGGPRAIVPRTHDGTDFGPCLRDVAHFLLPTPTATNFRGNARNGRGEPLLLGAAADRWGQYGDAIGRWEEQLGRAAPEPTVAGKRGGPQLSHLFVEWLMGLPEGHVTGVLDRKPALRVLGNGLVPAQGAAAYSSLLAVDRRQLQPEGEVA